MSAHSDSKSRSIDPATWDRAMDFFARTWKIEPDSPHAAVSWARTATENYFSARVGSTTHLSTISSELGALVQATSQRDPRIIEVNTIVNGDFFPENAVRLIGSHAARTGNTIDYHIFNPEKNILFSKTITPVNNPIQQRLHFFSEWKHEKNVHAHNDTPIESQARAFASNGMFCHFGSKERFSTYGAAVLADGNWYSAGAYGCPDYVHGINGIHAEAAAAVCAMMDGHPRIEAVGLISSKFKEAPVTMCGNCRQFFAEIQQAHRNKIEVFSFALAHQQPLRLSIDELLPHAWNPGV